MTCCMHGLSDGRELCCNCGEILTNGHSDDATCWGHNDWAARIIETAPLQSPLTMSVLFLHRIRRLHEEIDRLTQERDELRDEMLMEADARDREMAAMNLLLTTPAAKS